MIITRDMLIAANISKDGLNIFDFHFTNEIDLGNKTYCLSISFIVKCLAEIYKLFNYTGLFSCYDDDIISGLSNKPHIIHQANFVNGYLENKGNNPALVSCDFINKYTEELYFYKKGIITNFSPTLPAVISYFANKLHYREFFKNGLLHDPALNVPAHLLYHHNGKISQISYYKNGNLDNPDDNTPAYALYSNNGNLYNAIYFNNGLENDPPNGQAAVTYYNKDGSVDCENHYKNGVEQ